jgi:hypothetical protein
MLRVHVIPTRSGWAVRVLGETLSMTDSSVAGEIFARRYLEARGGGELVLHTPDNRAPKLIRIEVGPSGDFPVDSGP